MPRSGSLEPDEVVRPASGPLLYPPRCAEAAGRTWLRSTNRRSSREYGSRIGTCNVWNASPYNRQSAGSGGGRGSRKSVGGKVRPDDHDHIDPGGVGDGCRGAERLHRGSRDVQLGGDFHGCLLLCGRVVDGGRRRGRCRVLRGCNLPSLLLEHLREVSGHVGLLCTVGDRHCHSGVRHR